MCGIISAVSNRNIAQILLEGLYCLEYRGYDSAGIAVVDVKKNLICLRRLGKVKILSDAIKKHPMNGRIGIAHTRWATHGKPSEKNAHPQISKYIVVAHNGIIENHDELRKSLQEKGYIFLSETDTEVIAHLVHSECTKVETIRKAILCTISKLRGSYSMVIMDSRNPNHLFAVRFGSPLIIGIGIQENFIASDQLALLPLTHRFIFLEEGDIAEVTCKSVIIFDKFNSIVTRKVKESNLQYDVIKKGIYDHYMQKEIYEQPNAIKNTIKDFVNHNKIDLSEFYGNCVNKIFLQVEHIQIIGCGTSYNSGMVSRYWFEEFARVPCDVEIASEFCYRKPAMRRNSLLIILSQSGETADTLSALRISKKLSYLGSLAICNMSESTLVRESDLVILTKAGIEIGVASTKTFTSQLTVLLILVAKLARLKGQNSSVEDNVLHALQNLPSKIEKIFSNHKCIKKLAEHLSKKDHAILIGRGTQYPIAIEGALKLKEITYIHAEAYAAGELKHGPIALIDSYMTVIVVAPNNNLLEKLKSNIEEVHARNGQLYIFTDKSSCFNKNKNIHIINVPDVEEIVAPILYIIPLQLLTYYVARIKGMDVDHPRNLAKSVTVE